MAALRSKPAIIAAILMLIAAVAVVPLYAQALTVSTDKTTYLPGETVIVSGQAPLGQTVMVTIINPDGKEVDVKTATAGTDGTYRTTFKLPSTLPYGDWKPGTYTVRAYLGTVTAEAKFQLIGGGVVKGRVIDETGAPLPDATVAVVETGVYAATGSDGRFSIVTGSGQFTLAVSKSGYASKTVSVTVGTGEVKDVGDVVLVSYIYLLNTTISELSEKIRVLEERLASINASINTIAASISNLDLTAISNSLVAMNSSLKELSSKIDGLSSSINTVANSMSTVTSNLNKLDSKIDGVVSSVNTVSSKLDNVVSTLNTVASSISTVSSKIDSVASSVSAVGNKIDSAASTLSSKIDGLSSSISTVANKVDSVSGKVDSLSNAMSTVASKVDSLSSKIDGLSSSVDATSSAASNAFYIGLVAVIFALLATVFALLAYLTVKRSIVQK